jgi:hypothetical protein
MPNPEPDTRHSTPTVNSERRTFSFVLLPSGNYIRPFTKLEELPNAGFGVGLNVCTEALMRARYKPRLSQDRWLRRQFFREWAKGLGTQFGLCSLVSGGLVFCTEVWSSHRLDHSTRLFAELFVLVAVTFVVGDGYACQRRCCFPLLRRVARRCLGRMRGMEVSSPVIERFIHDVSFSPRMECRYRLGMAQSLRGIIEALDRLCCTAERYGCIGKHVFAANEEPIVRSLRLLATLPAEVGDEVALLPVLAWLQSVPEYDPEGWSLSTEAAHEQVRSLSKDRFG